MVSRMVVSGHRSACQSGRKRPVPASRVLVIIDINQLCLGHPLIMLSFPTVRRVAFAR